MWLEENGPCARCGANENLEVDHIDPLTKVSHNVWTWAEEKRLEELAKCQVLCHNCHVEKSSEYKLKTGFYDELNQTIKPPIGMAWCYIHKDFAPIEEFTKNASKRNGIQDECKTCRSLKRSPYAATETI